MDSSQILLPTPVLAAISFVGPIAGTSDVLGFSSNPAVKLQETPLRWEDPPAPQPRNEQGEENNMGEISDLLQQKAGLSPDKAQEVEQVVVEYIKSKVPSEFQGMLGSVLGENSGNGQQAESGELSGLLGAASSLFGNKG